MNKNSLIKSTLVIFLLVFGLSLTANTTKILSKMKSRLPAIVTLKKKGIIGENNRGYLQYVGKVKEKQNLIEAENRDRKAIYTLIAKKDGATVKLVGVLRAKQIAGKSENGYWLQAKNGKWYKK